ncbi:hypothetical protein SAMN02982929_04220 [Saccharopolyspora kobensis]|uniref:Uncharacterized protein n=1 Tax=Saccharopolyspora kobensis TaxID=146035 RepID=A0A1H6DCN4_9PSEU|nr:hypothetical protein SAMN02982929_04220 [Saccharopolyspora kobensis]SFE29415.1 hypothetical protein SAMN05216506_110137 [Saccharopolyspora kobensis]
MLSALPYLAAVSTTALILITLTWCTYRPQHAGGGEGALTVWQLIEEAEAERRQRERTGRHRLREPAPPSPEPGPSIEVQRRIHQLLQGL